MEQHELQQLLLSFTQELGRTPSKEEFYKQFKGVRFATEKFYQRSYLKLLAATGLEPLASGPKNKITNEIFKRDIELHISNQNQKEMVRSKKYPKILIIGDLHFPFHHAKCLEAIHEFCKETQPNFIVQIGDLYDMYSHAKFPRSHNLFTAKEEEKMARSLASKMWQRFQLDSPESKCIQILGNHDVRPTKRVIEVLPQMEHWVERYFEELMSFENVQSILNPREEFKIEDIVFIHGYANKLGDHRDHFLGNTVVGHTHLGGVSFRQLQDKNVWELNVGFCGNQFAKGLSYTPTKTVKWTLGWGLVDSYGARFISY